MFELDRAGGAEVLKEMAAAHIEQLANQVAAAVGEGAVVEMSTTDRARATVKVPADVQAVDGVLSRAAAEVGLEVKARRRRKKKRAADDKPAKQKAVKKAAKKKVPAYVKAYQDLQKRAAAERAAAER